MAEQKRYRIRVIGITWIDKVVDANNAEQAEEIADCIAGDGTDFRSNFIAEQTEVEEVDVDEELTQITDDDRVWVDYYQHQIQTARGGA